MALRVFVCKQADVVDGELRAFRVHGVTWPVIVTRVDGELHACPGVCPHEDVALWDGDLVGSKIICPGHGWSFDVKTGACAANTDLHLRRYKITLIDDAIWVDLL